MFIFLSTIVLFSACIAVHIVIWRMRLPKRQMRTLFLIFLFGFVGFSAVSLARHTAPLTIAYIAIYFWSVGLSYMITYSAIEADSPTLRLMRFIGASSLEGRSAEEITSFIGQRPFVSARLIALGKSRRVREQEGRFCVSGYESLAFRLILGFRRVYGAIPKGG